MRRDHSRAEFEQFVADVTDGLLRTAFLVVWDLNVAEDLVQECLIKVARRWSRVQSMEHRNAYARRILINLALDDSPRRQRHRSELDQRNGGIVDLHPDEAAARQLGAVETTSALLDGLALLPPRQRAVLVLRYFEDLSESQVSETLGCSVGTVKSTASRGIERLRQSLETTRPSGRNLLPVPSTNGVNDNESANRI
jgi:RNA polymerase sigma-70 factor (sigma-E family)